MKRHFEVEEKCPSCKGTGLYKGFAEGDGAAVVCNTCSGTGCHHLTYEYEEFTLMAPPPRGVRRVYRVNPGICIGEGNGHHLSDFGGMPVSEWKAGLPFPPGSEDRQHTCPAWYYQSADYKKKPQWKRCGLGSFRDCRYFSQKDKCWELWDAEFGGKDV